jgi:hypothetical protein
VTGVSGEAPPRVGGDGGTTTLVAGTTFCLSADGGDVVPGGVQGLFVDDTRVVSARRLRIDGAPVASTSCGSAISRRSRRS